MKCCTRRDEQFDILYAQIGATDAKLRAVKVGIKILGGEGKVNPRLGFFGSRSGRHCSRYRSSAREFRGWPALELAGLAAGVERRGAGRRGSRGGVGGRRRAPGGVAARRHRQRARAAAPVSCGGRPQGRRRRARAACGRGGGRGSWAPWARRGPRGPDAVGGGEVVSAAAANHDVTRGGGGLSGHVRLARFRPAAAGEMDLGLGVVETRDF